MLRSSRSCAAWEWSALSEVQGEGQRPEALQLADRKPGGGANPIPPPNPVTRPAPPMTLLKPGLFMDARPGASRVTEHGGSRAGASSSSRMHDVRERATPSRGATASKTFVEARKR